MLCDLDVDRILARPCAHDPLIRGNGVGDDPHKLRLVVRIHSGIRLLATQFCLSAQWNLNRSSVLDFFCFLHPSKDNDISAVSWLVSARKFGRTQP